MTIYLSLKKYENVFSHKLLQKNKINYFNDDLEIASFVDKNFNDQNKYIILTTDGIFLYSYLTKIFEAIVGIVSDEHSAHMTAEHNKTNILIVPMILISAEMAVSIIVKFLNANFEDERHMVRLDMLVKELKSDE